jgi:uncharacterized membrane-anchored protein
MQDHPLRQALNDELHGRPGLPVRAPARITHLAFTITAGDRDPLEAVTRLCDALGVKPPAPATPHHAVEIENGLLKYERHGEFYRLSVTAEGNGTKAEAISRLPLGWIDELPGLRLVAIHSHILSKSSKAPDAKALQALFGHDDIACSKVSQGQATVWTDYRIGADGFTRLLIHEQGLAPLRLGRLTRRLHEIETYRMMALLAFPLARHVQGELGTTERALAGIIDSMAAVKGPEDDATLLAGLTAIARDVEALSNRTSFRFAAARAYAALVAKRIAELGEERVLSHQRLGVFLDRRFSPAMTTCNAVAERIAGLAARTERASNLLRTRVDIALEAQNQQLLKSMEQRTRQQLMLQETVEGLSVVAISYYLIQIAVKVFEGIPQIDAKFASWVSIPMIIAAVWLGVRRVRKRVNRAVRQ